MKVQPDDRTLIEDSGDVVRRSSIQHSTFRVHPSRRRRSRGFTLIEVLATLLILAIVVPVAMEAVSLATGTAGAARRRAEAAGLAEAQLAFLMTSGEWQTGTLQGDFTQQGYPEYQWQAGVSNWTEANIMQLDVIVFWTSARRGEESLVVSTLVYQLGFDDGSTEGADATGTTGTSGTGGTP